MAQPTITDLIAEHAARLLNIKGVVGIAEGLLNGKPCVQLHLSIDDASVRAKLPTELDGYPVDIIVTGEAELL